MGDDTVVVTSNIENGNGRPDISIELRLLKTWIIFEFKRGPSPSDDLETLSLKAKEQIIAKEYYMNNVGTNYLVGVAFRGKKMSSLAVEERIVPGSSSVAEGSSESGVAPAAEKQSKTKRGRTKSAVAAGPVEDEDSAPTSLAKKRSRK